MSTEEQLSVLRKKYIKASDQDREIIKRQARALQISLELQKTGKNLILTAFDIDDTT